MHARGDRRRSDLAAAGTGSVIGIAGDLRVDGDAERVLAAAHEELGHDAWRRGDDRARDPRPTRPCSRPPTTTGRTPSPTSCSPRCGCAGPPSPLLVDAGGGAIVTTAAYSVRAPKPHQVPYAALKAAVATLTKTIAKSFGPTACARTACARARRRPRSWPRCASRTHATAAGPRTRRSNGRWSRTGACTSRSVGPAKPAEVGDVIAFLLSERASYVTGALVNIDGGTDF